MRFLFIKEGLNIGGTTSSFLNLLSVLPKDKDNDFDVWINDADNYDLTVIPEGVRVVSLPLLQRAFYQSDNRLLRFGRMLIDGVFIQTVFARINNSDRTKLIPSNQKLCLSKAKHRSVIDLANYDAVITWEEFFPCYLLAEKIKTKHKIAWIHPDYIECGFKNDIDRESFRKIDAIVAVSESGMISLKNSFPEFPDKFRSIRNRINIKNICDLSMQEPTDMFDSAVPILLTVARIQNISKAIDRALRVAKRLVSEGFDFIWYVIGGGEDLEEMKIEAKHLELQDYFVFLGERKNPYCYIKHADLFVLQSYYEGCPMVVDEALALKTPVIVSNYQSAVEQVNEEYGMIVNNDENDIFDALRLVLQKPEMISKWKANLEKSNISNYEDCTSFFDMLESVCK